MNQTLMHTSLKMAHRILELEDLMLQTIPYVQLVECLQKGDTYGTDS